MRNAAPAIALAAMYAGDAPAVRSPRSCGINVRLVIKSVSQYSHGDRRTKSVSAGLTLGLMKRSYANGVYASRQYAETAMKNSAFSARASATAPGRPITVRTPADAR